MADKGGSTIPPALICRNVTVSGRRTSLRMEPLLWDSLRDICDRENMTLNQLCTEIDRRRGEANLTASIRVFIVSYYRKAVQSHMEHRSPPGTGDVPQTDSDGKPTARSGKKLSDFVVAVLRESVPTGR